MHWMQETIASFYSANTAMDPQNLLSKDQFRANPSIFGGTKYHTVVSHLRPNGIAGGPMTLISSP